LYLVIDKIYGEILDPGKYITVGNVSIMLAISVPGEQISLVKCVLRGTHFSGKHKLTPDYVWCCNDIWSPEDDP